MPEVDPVLFCVTNSVEIYRGSAWSQDMKILSFGVSFFGPGKRHVCKIHYPIGILEYGPLNPPVESVSLRPPRILIIDKRVMDLGQPGNSKTSVKD